MKFKLKLGNPASRTVPDHMGLDVRSRETEKKHLWGSPRGNWREIGPAKVVHLVVSFCVWIIIINLSWTPSSILVILEFSVVLMSGK